MTLSPHSLELRSLTKAFGERVVLEDFELMAEPGEIVGITGPSGAGKTTICRLLSGVEQSDAGRIVIGGQDVTGMPAYRRGVAHMFESYALYPHMTVAENVAFPLKAPGTAYRLSAAEIDARIAEELALTRIEHLRDRLPGALSGGQKQRVALCRALVQEPRLYVLDEPISHLDAKLRNELRGAIRRRQTARPVATIWTSPDAMEALSIADRIAVLIDGRVQQYGTAEEIYFSPATTGVARLVGDPAMNLLPGRLDRAEGTVFFECDGARLALPESMRSLLDRKARSELIVLGVRPNGLDIQDEGEPGTVPMQVYAWEPFGRYSIITAQIGGELVRIKTGRMDRFEINRTIAVGIDPSAIVVFDQETGTSISA